MQNAPTDLSMTVDVKNEELEAQIKVYTKEKTRENLNQLIEIARTFDSCHCFFYNEQ